MVRRAARAAVIAADDDIEAGLLALGCLAVDEHAAARLRSARDPGFARAAVDWEARASALCEAARSGLVRLRPALNGTASRMARQRQPDQRRALCHSA